MAAQGAVAVLLRLGPDDLHRGAQPSRGRPLAVDVGGPAAAAAVRKGRPVGATGRRGRGHGAAALRAKLAAWYWKCGTSCAPGTTARSGWNGLPRAATCRASSSSPDLALSVADLASVYMGAVSFSTLAQAGLVDELTPGALLRADGMFAVRHKPWTPFGFS